MADGLAFTPDAAKTIATEDLGTPGHLQYILAGHPGIIKTAVYNSTAAQTDDNVLPAISAGTKYAITRITVFLDEATTVGVAVTLGFGASTLPALAASGADAVDGLIAHHPGMVPGTGFNIGDGSAIFAVGGDAEELRLTSEAPTNGKLAVCVSYLLIT